MSRVGKQPVEIPDGVQVQVNGRQVEVRGAMGLLTWEVPDGVLLEHDAPAKVIRVTRANDAKQTRANHGLSRALVANMVHGVSKGFERELLVYGTGYGCRLEGGILHVNVGFSGRGHNRPSQFAVPVPEGVEVQVLVPAARGESTPAKFVVRGADKQKVGQFAAEVRKIQPPEPYLGKGIRYRDEVVKRKAGKAFASGAGG
ncbi:MAG: 50S ribosomal protein L6 [Phycisphaerales bacterium]|nr:MAG: 50S ribosomal protein L6 [Phycisphaerales bacterium]